MNKYKPYLHIITEDEAIHTLAASFIETYFNRPIQIKLPKYSGSFKDAEQDFIEMFVPQLSKNANCHLLLLVDCDGEVGNHGRKTRAQTLLGMVEEAYRDRVFILTFERESEDFLGKFSPPKNSVGDRLADLCLNPLHPDLRPQWDIAEKAHLIRPKATVTNLRKMLAALRS